MEIRRELAIKNSLIIWLKLGLKDRSLAMTRIIQIKKAGSAIKLFGFQSWLYCLLWRLGQVNQPLWFSEGL